ncbi:hypothetical protein PFFCH_05094 [Plasmodium falciparum FCH/4]|uniref:Uncharacterized protein n=1 Tax=Plasmodium falciparum FCH/4 TaxID=1036724 RepID=A0A024VG65_PLAFA|nr:hypothetical protein PFFCH_05094 [Plasmodium falciparum FCH/4]
MIYLKGENKIISINEEDINDENYIIIKSILKDEKICMNGWIQISFIFYEKNYYKLFLDLIKEGDIFFEDYNNKIFNILLLVYNLEKIINVKNENKEDELKIKLENLLNQIEKKIKEKNDNHKEIEKYNSDTENKDVNKLLNNNSEYNNKNYYNKYDYLSYLMIKGIYNINMYLYLLNKYDYKCGTNNLFSSSVIKKTIDSSINVNGNVIINNNEFTNPLNYLIHSINIFILLLKKNNFDFISSIYLSFALCLIYKLDACIQFSSYVLIRIIHFQNFLNLLLEDYKIKYVHKNNNPDNRSITKNNVQDMNESKDEKKKTAKSNLIYLYKKCRNAYVIKLYVFFFVHTSNIYLNYNVLNKETIKKKEINRRENKNDVNRNELHKNDTHNNDITSNHIDSHMNNQTNDYVSYHIDNKFCKSNRNQHVKILHKVLLNMIEIINKNEIIFDNNLDIILLKAKIYELLITKYSNEYIESYFKLLDDIYEVKYFFTIKNKSPKLSIELINNYIVSMFYCNYKQKSLGLIELLKDEIFCKIKKFHTYYTYAILCKGKSSLCNIDNLLNKDKLYNVATRKEVNHIYQDKNNKRKSNCDNTTIGHNNKRRKNEIHDKDLKIEEQNFYDQKKKDDIDINESIHFHENVINSINRSKLKCKEMLQKNIKKLKYIKDILRYHRIFEIQNNIINIKNHNMIKKKNTHEIYNKIMKKERYINLINYLKKLYITISFNNIILLEIVGYKNICINMYKIFTEIYINYECAFIRLANIYIKNKNFLKAKQIIDNGLQKNPSSIKLHLLKSYMHYKRKHYDYSIYTLEKLKREDQNKNVNINKNNPHNNDSILINTYISIIKFHKIKECKSKEEKNSIINEIYNKIQLLLEKKSNYFIANLIGVLLNINNKYDIAYESFQIIIDSYEKLSFYYISSIKNIIYLMFNHLIRNNHIINNKLFLNKLNLFFNLSVKYGLNDKKIYLCYSNYLHVLEKYDDAINLLYLCYKKWPYDISILNSLIIIIDSCVSKYLSYEYVDLKNIFFMKGLIHFSFQVIYTLLYLKHFTTTAPLLSSGRLYDMYNSENVICVYMCTFGKYK